MRHFYTILFVSAVCIFSGCKLNVSMNSETPLTFDAALNQAASGKVAKITIEDHSVIFENPLPKYYYFVCSVATGPASDSMPRLFSAVQTAKENGFTIAIDDKRKR